MYQLGFAVYPKLGVANPSFRFLHAECHGPPSRPKDNTWKLKTSPGTSEYLMYTEEKDGRRILVCTVGGTVLHYDLRRIDDLHTMLKKAGDWVELGGADEQNPVKDGMVETWVARKPTRWVAITV
jgi:hypothetical protein